MRETCVSSQPLHTVHDVARGHSARYTANYRVADPMLWGRHTGCAFVQDKCIDAAGAPVDDRHFCNTLYWASDLRCTVDRMSFAYVRPCWWHLGVLNILTMRLWRQCV